MRWIPGRTPSLAVAVAMRFALVVIAACGSPEPPDQDGGARPPVAGKGAAPAQPPQAEILPLGGGGGELEPRPTAVAAALRARQYDALEQLFTRLADSEAADPAQGEIPAQLAAAGLATGDPEFESILIEWRARSRESPIPDLALALHYDQRAGLARGGAYARDTPRAAFEEAATWKAKALRHAHAAVERRPDLVDGWRVLIHVAQGEPERCVRVAEKGLATSPASYRIRAALMVCLQPRWGGRYELMSRVAREAARQEGRNRRLAELAGFAALDRADLARADKEYTLAERWLAEAAESAVDGWRLPRDRSRLLDRQGRATEALAEIDRALERWPELSALLEERVGLLSDLGRDAEARAVIGTLAAIDPASSTVTRWSSYLAKNARKQCEALARQQLYVSAIDSCREAIGVDPADASSRSWLGYALLRLDRFDEAKVELHAAVATNPRQRDAIVNLDWLYARTKEWKPVLALWDAYLELEPGDARAWKERAGTHSQLRNMAASCRDMRKACDLGSEDACALADRGCAGR